MSTDKKVYVVNNKMDLAVFLRVLIQRCMGKALDYSRMSGMSDRSLKQFEVSVKNDFYNIIKEGQAELKAFGYSDDRMEDEIINLSGDDNNVPK